MDKVFNDTSLVDKALDALIESARMLGATESRKVFDCYTSGDATFERAMHQAIIKHSVKLRAILKQYTDVSQKPSAWMIDVDDEDEQRLYLHEPLPAHNIKRIEPLYTNQRRNLVPLTNEQVKAGLIESIESADQRERCAFNIGVRFAERTHGIGVDNE